MPQARPTTFLALGLAVPLAAIVAIAALARFQTDAVAAAETGYLALAAGAVLLAAAGVAGRPTSEGLVGALLTVTAIWALPAGPARGAAATALAAAVLGLSTLRRAGALSPAGPGATGSDRAPDGGLPSALALSPGALVPLAVGLQALLRGSDLLAAGPALRTLAIFVVLPVGGALAVAALAGLEGRRRALLAAAVALAVGPGFRPATVVALAALAAGAALAPSRDADRGWRALGVGPDSPLRRLPAGAGTALAAAVIVLPFAWSWRAAAVSAAAALVLGADRTLAAASGDAGQSPRQRALRLAPPLAIAGLVLAVAALLPGRDPVTVLALASLLLLALPALALPAAPRGGLALAAVLLALAAVRTVTVAGALAAPLALGALAVEHRGPRAAAQGVWAGLLLAVAALAGAYPWLRPAPLQTALELLGLEIDWPHALAAAAGLGLLAAAAAWWARGPRGSTARIAGGAVAVAAAGLLLLALPRGGTLLITDDPVELGSGRTSWRARAGGDGAAGSVRAAEVLIDTSLANAGALAAGTPVATLRLARAKGEGRALVWTLRVGDDTGEWAAGRADLATAGLAPAPAPWLSWVAEGGEFFGGRYRAAHRMDGAPGGGGAPAVETVELRLRPDLPPGVTLTVFHLELRP